MKSSVLLRIKCTVYAACQINTHQADRKRPRQQGITSTLQNCYNRDIHRSGLLSFDQFFNQYRFSLVQNVDGCTETCTSAHLPVRNEAKITCRKHNHTAVHSVQGKENLNSMNKPIRANQHNSRLLRMRVVCNLPNARVGMRDVLGPDQLHAPLH